MRVERKDAMEPSQNSSPSRRLMQKFKKLASRWSCTTTVSARCLEVFVWVRATKIRPRWRSTATWWAVSETISPVRRKAAKPSKSNAARKGWPVSKANPATPSSTSAGSGAACFVTWADCQLEKYCLARGVFHRSSGRNRRRPLKRWPA